MCNDETQPEIQLNIEEDDEVFLRVFLEPSTPGTIRQSCFCAS